jgi:hypothetical protein
LGEFPLFALEIYEPGDITISMRHSTHLFFYIVCPGCIQRPSMGRPILHLGSR